MTEPIPIRPNAFDAEAIQLGTEVSISASKTLSIYNKQALIRLKIYLA